MKFSDRIALAIRQSGLAQYRLAAKIGVDKNTVSRWAKGRTVPDREALKPFADETGVDLEWLMTGKGEPSEVNTPFLDLLEQNRPPDQSAFEENFSKGLRTLMAVQDRHPLGTVPVLGSAAGALAGSMTLSNEPVEWVRRPDGLAHVPDAYALYVVGNSMASRYLPGDVIFVHPHKPCRTNDVVVIQIQNGEGGHVTSYLKIYGGVDGDDLLVSQFSDSTKIRFKLAYIKAIHRVMTNNELYQL
jgi:phage repressor protein C with HTH and peptisase S24 domain